MMWTLAVTLAAVGLASWSATAAAQAQRRESKPAAQAADPGGWQKARWGMSQRQVAAAVPGAQEFDVKTKTGVSREFGLPAYDVEGCNFRVEFDFDAEKLKSVSLDLTGDKNPINCPGIIMGGLKDRYGAPSSNDTSVFPGMVRVTTETLEWIFPKSIVRVRYTNMDASATFLSVTYTSRSGSKAGGKL